MLQYFKLNLFYIMTNIYIISTVSNVITQVFVKNNFCIVSQYFQNSLD